MTKEIPLTRGKVTIVDDDMYEYLAQWKWYCRIGTGNNFYAVRTSKAIKMHRVITDAPLDKFVDHIDGNGLNNTKANLRLCTHQENTKNRKVTKKIGASSQYKGVCYNKRLQKWEANIRIKGKQKYLGLYTTEEDAAKAYNRAAIANYGQFARLNEVQS